MSKSVYILPLLLLAACSHSYESAKGAAARDTYPVRKKIADFFYPEGEHLQPAITTYEYSYCYKSWADVTCYRQPVAGQENRLVEQP